VGASNSQPNIPIGGVCTVTKTAQGQFVVSGDHALLRDYFENDPEQWLRCLALKTGEQDGRK